MKTNLSGHYCLATKEHCEQLVKDGVDKRGLMYYEDGNRTYGNDEIFYVENDGFYLKHISYIETHEPMHYHNNQWHFGSLKHEGEHDIFGVYYDGHDKKSNTPPKRITRDMEYHSVKDMSEVGYEIQWNEVCDYIEYLESNQKEK